MPHLEEFQRSGEQLPNNQPLLVDAKGGQCPGPIMTLANALKEAAMGQTITIEVTDQGFKQDAVSWSAVTGNTLESMVEKDGVITASFTKKVEMGQAYIPPKEDSMTIIVFSEELDKAFAAFNIGLGALAMGMKVQFFFTFWGLSLIRKKSDKETHKGLKAELISKILPASDGDLPLSHQNMMGIGAKMMKEMMKEKNVPPLDFMIHLAKFNGAKFIACNMSMSVMSISPDELMDGVEVGGVANMLEYARKSSLSYFI